MRFITAATSQVGELQLVDSVELFGVSGRWSLFSRLEVGASVELLAKQPSTSDEKPLQSVCLESV